MSLLTVKAIYKDKDETRRFKISLVNISMHEIDKAIRRSFSIVNSEVLVYAWRDPDNDYVRFTSQEELQEAMNLLPQDGILRLSVASKWRQVPHPSAVCSTCQTDIRGERYLCFECPRTNLCSVCWAKPDHAHSQHVLLVVRNPHFRSNAHIVGNIKKLLMSGIAKRLNEQGTAPNSLPTWPYPSSFCRPLDYSNDSNSSDTIPAGATDLKPPTSCLTLPAKLLRVGRSATSSLIGPKDKPKVVKALEDLRAMGYSDHWIKPLVVEADGDVAKVLDLISMQGRPQENSRSGLR